VSELRYVDLFHDCALPEMGGVVYGKRHQVLACWRCPECGSRWAYEASFLNNDRMFWTLKSRPRRKWRRAEAKRLNAARGAAS
jgi:hypothetical protein